MGGDCICEPNRLNDFSRPTPMPGSFNPDRDNMLELGMLSVNDEQVLERVFPLLTFHRQWQHSARVQPQFHLKHWHLPPARLDPQPQVLELRV